MLQKQAERIIHESARLAGVISPETDLTAAEIDDALYNLNCLLQSMNNDGFRLFTMETGYMPLIPKKNEYAMATEAFTDIKMATVLSFDVIGAIKVSLTDLSGMSIGQTIRFYNNTMSSVNTISAIDYDNKIVWLTNPLDMGVHYGDTVYYGLFALGDVSMLALDTSFSTLTLHAYEAAPVVGQNLMFKFENDWFRATITAFDAATKTITFSPSAPAGAITSRTVLFGQNINATMVAADAPLEAKRITFDKELPFEPVTVVLRDALAKAYKVERVVGNQVYLDEPVSETAIQQLADAYIYADRAVSMNTIASVGAFSGLTDPEIIGFGKAPTMDLLLLSDAMDNKYLYYRSNNGGAWTGYDVTDISGSFKGLYTSPKNNVVLMTTQGLYDVSTTTPVTLLSGIDVATVFSFAGAYFVVSEADTSSTARTIVRTEDFVNFGEPYSTLGLESVKNPVEFKGKLYIGSTMTTVTLDMVNFEQIPVYSENRCVVGDRLLNVNSAQVCSFSDDGVNFVQMPFMQSHQSAWAHNKGCSFISVYDLPAITQEPLCSQIFMTNRFDPDWQHKAVVNGKVFNMFLVADSLFAVSDVEVLEIKLVSDNAAHEEVGAMLCGNPIGRPQQLMNVVKYGFNSQTQLPMEAMALKDYEQLPHAGVDGEPVTFCFFRDAKDGKMMVWGTPTKFGEYLKFTYVRSVHLLDGVRDIPDFPDEYIGAVIDAFAVEMAHQYKAPDARIKELEAKAAKSMENAMLHDNEDTSYRIGITPRGY